MAVCKVCGQTVDDDASFCWACGAKMKVSQPAAEPEAELNVPDEENVPLITEEQIDPEFSVMPEAAREEIPQSENAGAESEPEQWAAAREEIPYRTYAKDTANARGSFDFEPEPQADNGRGRVIGTGGFFGTLLLLSIPGINLIMAIIWALGGTKRDNRKNLARGWLLLMLVCLVILAVGYLIVYLVAPNWVYRVTDEIISFIRNLF